MAQLGTAYVDVRGDFTALRRQTDEAATGIKRRFAGVSQSLKGLGAAAGVAAAGGFAIFGKNAIDAASDINESLTKNVVLFGEQAKAVDAFSKSSARAFGISRKAALEATGTFGNLFNAVKVAPAQAADLSVKLTKLAADMASFNNADPSEVLDALRSGLVGETEPLRRFGVNINDATLRQEALRKGLIETTKDALTPQQKALAATALIFSQTDKAQGDFARTSGGLANQQRILKAEFSDMSARIGTALLPAALALTKAFVALADATRRTWPQVHQIVRSVSESLRVFTERNREDLKALGEAVTNVAAAFRAAFENVILPVARRVLPAVAQLFRALGQIVRGVGRIVVGVLTLDFPRALRGVKDVVKGTLGSVLAQIKIATAPIREAATALGRGIKAGLKAGVSGVVGVVQGIINKVIDAINVVIRAANSVADKDPTGIAPHFNEIGRVGEQKQGGVQIKKRKGSSGPAGGDPTGRFSSRGGPIIGELHLTTPSGENPDGVATGVLIGRTIEQRFGGDPRQEP